MDLRELVSALLRHDALTARQWVADARRARMQWSEVPRPDVGPVELAVAAGVAETLAARGGQRPPAWTATVPAAPEFVYLLHAAAALPRSRRMCETESPEPLRRRRIFALPDFLTAA
jgi:hypothetical protein